MSFMYALIAGVVAFFVTCLGIFVMNRYREWGKRNVVYFMAFATGILIPISFLHLVPESFEMSRFAPIGLLVGFGLLHFLNRFLDYFVCEHDSECDHKFGLLPAIGIGLHSFVDGVIFSVTFSVSLLTGALTALGMILHHMPEGIITYIMLHKAGFSNYDSSLYAVIVAVMTPLGVVVSYPFIADLSEAVLGTLLSVTAGALIYVGATHLLPHVEEEPGKYSLIALLIGVVVSVSVAMIGH